jgi:hypothetical protein
MFGQTLEAESQLEVNAVLRRMSLLTLSCILSAFVVGGIGGRIVMRISASAAGQSMVGRITENGNRIGQFTIVGTLFLILLIGIFVALFGTVIVVASDPWLRWLGPLEGLGFGLATLAINGQQDNFGSTDFLILEPASLNISMFVALNLLFGLAVFTVYWILDKRLPRAGGTDQRFWAIAVVPFLMGFALLLAFLTLPGFSGAEADYAMAAILLVIVVSTAVRTASSMTARIPAWISTIATVAGYASMAPFLIVGLTGTVREIQRLV